MDPIGTSDGRRLDTATGEWIQHFQTKDHQAVFVSVSNVVKITPADLLGTLTDAIQKLNTCIVTVSQQNRDYLQQIGQQQQHIEQLTQKYSALVKSQNEEKAKARRIATVECLLSLVLTFCVHLKRCGYSLETDSFAAIPT